MSKKVGFVLSVGAILLIGSVSFCEGKGTIPTAFSDLKPPYYLDENGEWQPRKICKLCKGTGVVLEKGE